MTVPLGPEESLVVAAAGGLQAVLRPLGAGTPVDWKRVVDLASWQRVVPLLWDHLNSGRSGVQAPDEVMAVLRQGARESTARSLNLGMELGKAVAALADVGIPVVLLKGAALVETVYDHNPGFRPMGDLDLLVPRGDIHRAQAALVDLGYEVKARLNRDDDAWLEWIHHHLPLFKPDGSVMVELHHGLLVDRPDFDIDGVWQRAVPSDRGPHLLPSPEDLLLHVAAHFALDRMNRAQSALGQLADVVHIVGRWPIDWGAVAALSRRSRVADRVFLALSSANQLFGEVVPHDVVAGLAPPTYTERRGELFLRQRVLHRGASFPLEQLRGGPRRVFPGAAGLEWYIRRDDRVVPSRATLQARRIASVARRVASGLRGPVELVRDVRLSRWMVSLRS